MSVSKSNNSQNYPLMLPLTMTIIYLRTSCCAQYAQLNDRHGYDHPHTTWLFNLTFRCISSCIQFSMSITVLMYTVHKFHHFPLNQGGLSLFYVSIHKYLVLWSMQTWIVSVSTKRLFNNTLSVMIFVTALYPIRICIIFESPILKTYHFEDTILS